MFARRCCCVWHGPSVLLHSQPMYVGPMAIRLVASMPSLPRDQAVLLGLAILSISIERTLSRLMRVGPGANSSAVACTRPSACGSPMTHTRLPCQRAHKPTSSRSLKMSGPTQSMVWPLLPGVNSACTMAVATSFTHTGANLVLAPASGNTGVRRVRAAKRFRNLS